MKFNALAAAAFTLTTIPAHSAVFADFVSINPVSEVATGFIGGASFSLRSTRLVPRPVSGDNGGVVGGVTNETSTVFSSSTFSPSLPVGDVVLLGAASDFTITFSQAVTDVSFHIYQLEANRLTFTSGARPIVFSIVSSDGDLTASAGNTAIQGASGNGDDANGSILFRGTFTDISWTSALGIGASGNTSEDGIGFQMSVVPSVPELPPYILLSSALGLFAGIARLKKKSIVGPS